MNDEVRYPRFLSIESISIMRRVGFASVVLVFLVHFNVLVTFGILLENTRNALRFEAIKVGYGKST